MSEESETAVNQITEAGINQSGDLNTKCVEISKLVYNSNDSKFIAVKRANKTAK